MDNVITETGITLDALKTKYPDDDYVIIDLKGVEGDTLFDTWYITLDENTTDVISCAWKQIAEDW